MKKSLLLLGIMMFVFMAAANALTDANTDLINITLNYPINNLYISTGSAGNDAMLTFNVSVAWTTPMNITNATFVFSRSGTADRRFTNTTTTINGSRTTGTTGDFLVNISASQLAEGIYTVLAEIRNSSNSADNDNAVNSSSVSFGIDRAGPGVQIRVPLQGSTIVPNNNFVTIEYIPTDANLGNCSASINNQNQMSSTSGTISPNVSSGIINRFYNYFGNDNTSARIVIECIDLAGSKGNSANLTFNVLLGAMSPALRQQMMQQAAGGGGVASQQLQQASSGFTAASQDAISEARTSFQNYAWIYAVAAIALFLVIFRKKIFK